MPLGLTAVLTQVVVGVFSECNYRLPVPYLLDMETFLVLTAKLIENAPFGCSTYTIQNASFRLHCTCMAPLSEKQHKDQFDMLAIQSQNCIQLA